MATTATTHDEDLVGPLFSAPAAWADMDAWHERVAELRRTRGAVMVEDDGYEPFLVLLRHADVFEVSRDNTHWLNTARSVLGPDEAWEQTLASGMPLPA